MTPYKPPNQSARGQFLDALFIMVLLFVTLFATTYLTKSQADGEVQETEVAEATPISNLPVSDAEKQQFQKLVDSEIVDLEDVNTSVAANQPNPDKYAFSVLSLVITGGLIVAYMAFVYLVSFKQYKEVITEKFGSPESSKT